MTDQNLTTTSAVVEPTPTATVVNREARAKLYAALAKAQAAFKEVKKNKQANYGKYADLTAILDAVRPALNANGCFLYQDVRSVKEFIGVRTIIAHESGETLESSELFMPTGANGKANAAQAFGSARTYACRYSLSTFLGIAADDDDDGQSAAPASATPRRSAAPAPLPASTKRPIPNELADVPF